MILENDRCFFNEFEHVLTMILENDRCFLNEFLFEKEWFIIAQLSLQ